MDIEKMIEQFRTAADKWEAGHQIILTGELRVQDALRAAATVLSTLQAENEKLRAERVELEQMASCIYYKQGGLCRYGEEDPANVCVFGPCGHEKSAQEAQAELEQVKADRSRWKQIAKARACQIDELEKMIQDKNQALDDVPKPISADERQISPGRQWEWLLSRFTRRED